MLSVDEARTTILTQCVPLTARAVALLDALELVLDETIHSDMDSPPFDKALMDGYAVGGEIGRELEILEEIHAGQTPRLPLGPGQASRIMTGAPIPLGCEAIVPVEQTRLTEQGRVELRTTPQIGENILRRGREMKQGEVILNRGRQIRPQEIGLLAAVGKTEVAVIPRPRVNVLATGDELVEGTPRPGPSQIRNSNAPMLVAQARRAGAESRSLGIARDRVEDLREKITEGIATSEILVLSGGVSAGKLDLVPEVLRELGVTAHFHKIAMKPGKPLFFGTTVYSESKRYVFGLPGNPVSSLVCFELFLRPAIRKLAGRVDLDLPEISALLTQPFEHTSDRPTYYPASVNATPSGWSVTPVPWFGSADLRAFTQANGLLILPAGKHQFEPGSRSRVLRLEE